DAAQRAQAPALQATLARVRAAVRAGRQDYGALEAAAVEELARAGFRPDYVEVRRGADLAKPTASDRAPDLVVLGAAWLGGARLAANLRICLGAGRASVAAAVLRLVHGAVGARDERRDVVLRAIRAHADRDRDRSGEARRREVGDVLAQALR